MGLLRFLLAGVLLASAAAKLLAGSRAREAFSSYGVARPAARAVLWGAVIAVEAVLAVAVAAGLPGAAWAATAVLGLFALALLWAIARGRAGAPCGCFGARSRIGWPAVGRTALLAGAFAVLAVLPDTEPSTDAWLGIGLGVALAAVVVLGVAVLALAREVGELRLAIAPQAALSIEHEGPEIGSRLGLVRAVRARAAAGRRLQLAGLRALPRARAVAAPRRLRPRGRARGLRRGGGRRRLGLARDSRAAPTRSPSPRTARCWRRGRSTRSTSSRACSPPRTGRRSVLSDAVTGASSRRGFLARAGKLLLAVGGGGFVAAALKTQKAEAFHFCGHIYTTGSCPHPTGLPRIDSRGFPLRAADGRPVDDLGRAIDKAGRPVDAQGEAPARPGRQPAPAGAPHPDLPGRGAGARLPRLSRRLLVPLLRRPRPQARRLLRLRQQPHQRRRRAHRVLLPRPQGVLRHVLRLEDQVLTAALALTGLLVGLAGAWSP